MAKAAEAAPDPAAAEHARQLLLALIATDWLIGDKSHYTAIRAHAIRVLKQLGPEGAAALARLEGMHG